MNFCTFDPPPLCPAPFSWNYIALFWEPQKSSILGNTGLPLGLSWIRIHSDIISKYRPITHTLHWNKKQILLKLRTLKSTASKMWKRKTNSFHHCCPGKQKYPFFSPIRAILPIAWWLDVRRDRAESTSHNRLQIWSVLDSELMCNVYSFVISYCLTFSGFHSL